MAILPIPNPGATHLRLNMLHNDVFRLGVDVESEVYTISIATAALPPGITQTGNDIFGRFTELGTYRSQLMVTVNGTSVTLNVEFVVGATQTAEDFYIDPTILALLQAIPYFFSLRVGDTFDFNLDLGSNTTIEMTIATLVAGRGRAFYGYRFDVPSLTYTKSHELWNTQITDGRATLLEPSVRPMNKYRISGTLTELGDDRIEVRVDIDGYSTHFEKTIWVLVRDASEPLPDVDPPDAIVVPDNTPTPEPIPEPEPTPEPIPEPIPEPTTPTPTLVHGTVRDDIKVAASIGIRGDIEVPAGENPTTTTFFDYSVGDPAADRFKAEFFGSEEDAIADVNPLTDVNQFLLYEIHPSTPLAGVGQAGHITLTRIDRIPYEMVCLKLSICQEGREVTTSDPIPINIDSNRGINRPRSTVYSNWRRR